MHRMNSPSSPRWMWVAPAGLMVSVCAWPVPGEPARLHIVDVGQGEAVLVEHDDGNILIDGGWDWEAMAEYLTRKDIEALDLVAGTHGHADHIGGLVGVLDQKPVEKVWYNGQSHDTQTFERFRDAKRESGAEIRRPIRGHEWRQGELAVTVLHPTRSATDYDGHLHDKNLVVRVEAGDLTALVTGDAEQEVELKLVDEDLVEPVDVIQLGHHGSHTSTAKAFIRAADPELAVYQAEPDHYGHPHDEPMAVLEALGVPVYGTDEHGTMLIEIEKEEGQLQITEGRYDAPR